jgi:hypothetical protein
MHQFGREASQARQLVAPALCSFRLVYVLAFLLAESVAYILGSFC